VLTIGGISMNRLAWMVAGDDEGEGSLFSLLTLVEQRGEDRTLPGATGVIAYRRRSTVTTHELGFIVIGEVDANGAPNADHTLGLYNNLAYIMTNVVTPVVSSTGTRAATWDPPGGATQRTANIHVTGLRQRNLSLGNQAIWQGNLLISIPAGAFA
jgi:hypothetical protein